MGKNVKKANLKKLAKKRIYIPKKIMIIKKKKKMKTNLQV